MLGPQSAAGKQRSCGDTCFILSYEIILELWCVCLQLGCELYLVWLFRSANPDVPNARYWDDGVMGSMLWQVKNEALDRHKDGRPMFDGRRYTLTEDEDSWVLSGMCRTWTRHVPWMFVIFIC
jgi:hypothetical protein